MENEVPHIIHYFWFGDNPKSKLIEQCIESWKIYFPDWEIKEWNETNYDVHKSAYASQAYKLKKWAFVSDFARCDILEEYGGLYFDTDVEVLKKFPNELFEKEAFTGVESGGKVSPGLVFYCPPHFWLVQEMLESYRMSVFENLNRKSKPMTINERITRILVERGYRENGKMQYINGLSIYPSEYFCAYDLSIHEPEITGNSITMHHYAGSWKEQTIKKKLQKTLKCYIGIKNYRSLLGIKRKLFGISRH